MSFLQHHISYAEAAASALDPSLHSGLNNLRVKDGKGGSVLSIQQEQDNTEFEAVRTLPNTNLKPSRRSTQADPSCPAPKSAGASEHCVDLYMSISSGITSNDAFTLENDVSNATRKNKHPSPHFKLSPWTGGSTQAASEAFSPLASSGSARARPLSPILSARRQSRFSRFFPSIQNVSEPNNQGVKELRNDNAALDNPGSPDSSFLLDGLSGGFKSTMSDTMTQQRNKEEDVKSYIASQHTSLSHAIGPSGRWATARENVHFAAVQPVMNSIPLATSDNAAVPSHSSVAVVGQKERPKLARNLLSSVQQSDGTPLIPRTKVTRSVHDFQAILSVPRCTPTTESLKQTGYEINKQRNPTIIRPQPFCDQSPDWGTRADDQGLVRNDGSLAPAPLSSGEAHHLHDMYLQASSFGRGNMAEDTQRLSVSPLAPSTFPPIPSSSSQNLTTPSSHSNFVAISKREIHLTSESFYSMNAVLHPDAYKQPLSKKDIAFREKNGISLNYHGNHENPRNISANIPDRENCAVWITNLPAKCTYNDLLKALMVHRPGRVWATHINAPAPPNHLQAAAKVVFYHPSEAQRFLDLSRQPGIFVQDRRISAIYNKQRVPAREYSYPTSRALEIRGDKVIVNEKFLQSLFESRFRFQNEAIEVLAEFGNLRVIEWRFGSMRAQAASAYKLLERMYPCVDVRYATDPCAHYIASTPHNQHIQLVAPLKGGLVPRNSLDAPGGSGKMS